MIPEPNLGSDPIFKRFQAAVKEVTHIVDSATVKLDAITCELKVLAEGPPVRSSGSQATASDAHKARRALNRSEGVMAAEAARGACRIEKRPLPDGSVAVVIDGRPATLPPMLALFFSALIADIGPSDDGFVSWKSQAQIQKMLSKPSGEFVTAGALTNLVHRLRKTLLLQANLHRDFILRHPRRGLRFALRRPGPDAGGGAATTLIGADF